MVTKSKATATAAAATAAAAVPSTLTAGLELLHAAGRNASNAGTYRATAKEVGASALDATIAGLSQAGVLTHGFAFDVCDRGGNVIEHKKATLCDFGLGFFNENGTASRATEGAFRAAMLPLFFGITGDQSAGAKSVWQTFKTGFATAKAVVGEGMTARIEGDKLVLEGGTGDKAEALRKASAVSTTALVKAAKGEAGTNGSTSKTADVRAATPEEITRAAVAVVKLIVRGEEAVSSAALANLRELAKLVSENADLFAED
jgi:hypothetical protein